MRFVEFTLTPIEEIGPWGNPGSLSLSWFGFSLGRYRLRFGDEYLLNYSDQSVVHIARNYPNVYPGPWVDYQVVRLWEDLIRLAPYALLPVPPEMAPLLRLSEPAWGAWLDSGEAAAGPGYEHAVDLLRTWRDRRFLDSGYLNPGSPIWLWSVEDDIEVRWDNSNKLIDGVPAWSATRGSHRFPRAAFLDGLHAFNDDFIAAMRERVQEICAGWNHPEVHVDFVQLANEQTERTGWLAKELERTLDEPTDDLIDAARALRALVGVPDGAPATV